MVKKIEIKEVSPSFSMMAWDLVTFAKKRKKTLITMIGGLLGYVISNNEIIAILSAGLFEVAVSVVEYYFKKVN